MTRLEIGRVSKAHGLRGEVVVIPVTNQPDRFGAGTTVWLDGEETKIATSRPNQNAFLVRFEGVNDRTAAELLRGRTITAPPPGDAPDGEVWVHEVIGSEVRDRAGAVIGRSDRSGTTDQSRYLMKMTSLRASL